MVKCKMLYKRLNFRVRHGFSMLMSERRNEISCLSDSREDLKVKPTSFTEHSTWKTHVVTNSLHHPLHTANYNYVLPQSNLNGSKCFL